MRNTATATSSGHRFPSPCQQHVGWCGLWSRPDKWPSVMASQSRRDTISFYLPARYTKALSTTSDKIRLGAVSLLTILFVFCYRYFYIVIECSLTVLYLIRANKHKMFTTQHKVYSTKKMSKSESCCSMQNTKSYDNTDLTEILVICINYAKICINYDKYIR